VVAQGPPARRAGCNHKVIETRPLLIRQQVAVQRRLQKAALNHLGASAVPSMAQGRRSKTDDRPLRSVGRIAKNTRTIRVPVRSSGPRGLARAPRRSDRHAAAVEPREREAIEGLVDGHVLVT
jgi:hypothetical protein